jgi:type IV secretory pathway VirB10-like protein
VHIRGPVVRIVLFLVVGFLGAAAYSALTKDRTPPQVEVPVKVEASGLPSFLDRPPATQAEALPDPPPVPPKVETKIVYVQQGQTQATPPKKPREKTAAERALEKALKAPLFVQQDKNGQRKEPPQTLEITAMKPEKSPFELDGTVYPLTQFTLEAGDTIPVTLMKPINSELYGSAYAVVSRDVYDTATQSYLLVPAGSKVQLKYDHETVDSQHRLLVLADRIKFPPSVRYPYGSSIGLAGNPASDAEGYNGLHDKVDRHLLQGFGRALVYAAVAAGVGVANGGSGSYYNGYDPSDGATRAFGREMERAARNSLRHGENLRPTFTIRHGQSFTITLDKDLPFTEAFQPLRDTQVVNLEE